MGKILGPCVSIGACTVLVFTGWVDCHGLIYQLVKELQKQAEEFQIAVDPVYDRFLIDIHCVSREYDQTEASDLDFDHCDIARLLKQRARDFLL